MNTSSLRSAITSSSSHDLPADCSNQVDETAPLEFAHIVALAAQHASGSISLFRLTAVFLYRWRVCSVPFGSVRFAQHASGSISLFRLTAVFYLSAQLFLGKKTVKFCDFTVGCNYLLLLNICSICSLSGGAVSKLTAINAMTESGNA